MHQPTMTQKQRKEIARMWAAEMVYWADATAFDGEISQEDEQAIIEECRAISDRLLGTRPFTTTLPRIIEYVLGRSK